MQCRVCAAGYRQSTKSLNDKEKVMAVKWVGRLMMILIFVAICMAGFGSAVLYLCAKTISEH